MNFQRKHNQYFGIVVGVLLLGLSTDSWAAKGGTGKPGNDPPPELPNVRFSIDLVPGDAGYFNGSNNLGMFVGWTYPSPGEEKAAYLYDHRTKQRYELELLKHLFQTAPSVPDDWWLTWRLRSGVSINDMGDIVGSLGDGAGVIRPFLLETQLGFDPNSSPENWHFEFLPDMGSDYAWGNDINIHGDVLGLYRTSEGAIDAYLYNPWVDGPAGNPPLSLGVNVGLEQGFINDKKQVAGMDGVVAFVYDPVAGLTRLVDEPISLIYDMNEDGAFCGSARLRVNGRGPRRNVAYRYTGQLELPEKDGDAIEANAYGINTDNDMIVDWDLLIHTGSQGDQEQVWTVDDLIAESDPLKAFWVDNGHRIMSIAERDGTGFSQMVGIVSELQPDGTTQKTAVVLTPFIPDA